MIRLLVDLFFIAAQVISLLVLVCYLLGIIWPKYGPRAHYENTLKRHQAKQRKASDES